MMVVPKHCGIPTFYWLRYRGSNVMRTLYVQLKCLMCQYEHQIQSMYKVYMLSRNFDNKSKFSKH